MEELKRRVKGQAFISACIDQDLSSISRLISNEEYLNLINEPGLMGQSAIHISIFLKNVNILSLLLEAGADRNMRNSQGDTPLHCTCRVGFLEGLKLLCQQKIDTSPINNEGLTPRQLAESSKTAMRDEDMYGCYTASALANDIDMQGRRECLEYLKLVIEDRRVNRLKDYMKEVVDVNRDKQRVTSILRNGSAGRTKFYLANYMRPPGDTPECWTDKDYSDLDRDHSLFEQMVIAVSSSVIVRSCLNTTIMNFDEKKADKLKALRSEWWYLYNDKKEMFFIDAAYDLLVEQILTQGLMHIQQEVTSARSTISSELEYYESDRKFPQKVQFNIPSDSEMNARKPSIADAIKISKEFTTELICEGLENSDAISVDLDRMTFEQFSQSVVDSVVLKGLQNCLKSTNFVTSTLSSRIVSQIISSGLNSIKKTSQMHKGAHAVARVFVETLLSRKQHQPNTSDAILHLTEQFVSSVIIEGIVSLANNKEPKAAKGQSISDQLIKDSVLAMAEELDMDDPLLVNATTQFSEEFVKNVRQLERDKNFISGLDQSYISDFAPGFVNRIIQTGIVALQQQNQIQRRVYNDRPATAGSTVQEFTNMLLAAGMNEYNEEMNEDDVREQVELIQKEFQPEKGDVNTIM